MCLDLEKDLPDFWSITCPTSSHDANKFINTKSEEVSDVEEEEDPVPISFPQIKGEHEVSCVSVYHCWFSCQSDSFQMKRVHRD
jgi:hypothetical protein